MNKFIFLGLILVLAGCVDPKVTPNTIPSQYKIGPSAQHWQMLASRTADDLVKSLSKIEDIDPGGHVISAGQTKNLGARPYYVYTSASDAPFAKVFTPLLQEEFLKRGYAISRTPRNATIINYETKTFYYGGGRTNKAVNGAEDAEVVLTTSVVAESNILQQVSETLYIAPNDLPLYWSELSPGGPMETQIKLPVIQPIKTIRVAR